MRYYMTFLPLNMRALTHSTSPQWAAACRGDRFSESLKPTSIYCDKRQNLICFSNIYIKYNLTQLNSQKIIRNIVQVSNHSYSS